MKEVFRDKIINIDENLYDNKFLFKIAINAKSEIEQDMSHLLLDFKNENLDYKKDFKLWNQVYSPKKELEIFSDLFLKNLSSNKKIHISNISLSEEIVMIRDLYLDLWYFNSDLNRFEVDTKNAPITIWTNLLNIIYSFKDYNRKKEEIFFIPPPREPRHQKSLKSGINSSIISTIKIEWNKDEIEFLRQIILDEKVNFLKLSRSLYFNYKDIWFTTDESEIIIDLS